MAYVEPKTDWNETYTPDPIDFNRIENNIIENRNDIDSEESARISADNILQDNIDLEESARISADNSLDSRITDLEDLFEENIVAGDTVARFDNDYYQTDSTTYVSVTHFTSPFNGTLRVKFQHKLVDVNPPYEGSSIARIKRNATQIQEFTTSSTTYVNRSVDVSVSVGDIIYIEHKAVTETSAVKNFGLYYNGDDNILFTIWATQ